MLHSFHILIPTPYSRHGISMLGSLRHCSATRGICQCDIKNQPVLTASCKILMVMEAGRGLVKYSKRLARASQKKVILRNFEDSFAIRAIADGSPALRSYSQSATSSCCQYSPVLPPISCRASMTGVFAPSSTVFLPPPRVMSVLT